MTFHWKRQVMVNIDATVGSSLFSISVGLPGVVAIYRWTGFLDISFCVYLWSSQRSAQSDLVEPVRGRRVDVYQEELNFVVSWSCCFFIAFVVLLLTTCLAITWRCRRVISIVVHRLYSHSFTHLDFEG